MRFQLLNIVLLSAFFAFASAEYKPTPEGVSAFDGSKPLVCDKPGQYYLDKMKADTDTMNDRLCLTFSDMKGREEYANKTRLEAEEKEKKAISDALAAGLYVVDYEVLAPESASLTFQNQDGSTEQHTVRTPWRLRLFKKKSDFVYISAQNGSDYGGIRVRLLINGVEVRKAESTSKFGIATASGKI